VPEAKTYRAGQQLRFTVNYSGAVFVNSDQGTPSIGLNIGSASSEAEYHSGSGTTALVFRHTIQAGDESGNGIQLTSLNMNGGSIRDGMDEDASSTLAGVGDTSGVRVDAVAPYVVSLKRKSPSTQVIDTPTGIFEVTFS